MPIPENARPKLHCGEEGAAVTPSDSVALTHEAEFLYVGTGGTVVLLPVGNSAVVTLVNVPDGTFLPIKTKRVNSTSTTASNIVAFW